MMTLSLSVVSIGDKTKTVIYYTKTGYGGCMQLYRTARSSICLPCYISMFYSDFLWLYLPKISK